MDEVSVATDLARVVHVIEGYQTHEVVINRGLRQGIKEGARYLIFGYGPEVTDPDTGESLGRIEIVRGRGEVVHVQDNLATIRSIEQDRDRGKRITRRGGFLGLETEEVLDPAKTMPFVGVVTGDIARPI